MNKGFIQHQAGAGFSLLETLVVLSVFSLLAVITSTVVILAVRGTKKSDNTARVRQNIDFALATIERQIRNASSIVSCSQNKITFVDQDQNQSSFSCVGVGAGSGYVASASAQLTADQVNITACQFSCTAAQGSSPPSVSIDLTGTDKNATGAQSSTFTANTQIFLRTY